MRLARTIDLTSVAASDAPALAFQLSWNTELGYDNVIVEATPAGTDDWTTLPESRRGHEHDPTRPSAKPASCSTCTRS